MVRPGSDGAQQAETTSGASGCFGRDGGRLVLGDLPATQCGFWLQQQLLQGALMVVHVRSAVKAGMTCEMLALGRCVPQDAVDERVNGQRHRLGAMVPVVGVLKAHGRLIQK